MSDAYPIVDAHIRPVILSGGAGTRLWPLSTAECPKQFLPLVGDSSLLAQTFARVDDSALFSEPLVICGAAHVDQVRTAAADAGFTQMRIVAEPAPRNTAAAVALAVLTARNDEELLLILPSDHHIERPDRFRATVDAARAGSDAGLIVTFGMKPTRIETGFGYIERGGPIAGAVSRAVRFVEKPDAAAARTMIESGDYLWNGGIFLATVRTFRAAFEAHCPDLLAAVAASLSDAQAAEVTPDLTAFEAVRAVAFDHAVMEKFAHVGVIPSDFGWSDVGSWLAAFDQAACDSQGNAVAPGSVVLGGSGNLLRSSGPRLVALGVDGLMILATDEVVLVAPLSEAQRVREAAAWYANGAKP
ncbi:MAG: mannose-1-phosphate guanylyltransferase/mannose-6-phosphate isomerase [Sphingomicrobium sp.]